MKRAGVLAALVAEASCLLRPAPAPGSVHLVGDRFMLVLSGMGPDRANGAAGRLLDAGAGALISFGVCGALDPELAAGDLVVPEVVIDGETRFAAPAGWRAAVLSALGDCPVRVHGGELSSVRRAVPSVGEKTMRRERVRAQTIDMESGAVAAAAARASVPFMVLRSVADPAGMRIPDAVLRHADPYGRVSAGALALSLLRRPGDAAALVRLGLAFGRASRTLRWLGQRLDRFHHEGTP